MDVPATNLIQEIASDFKEKLQKPDFAEWVKTGAHTERSPQNRDWWYMRAASVLYRVYVDGPLGTETLRTYYGGKRNRGSAPHKFRKASGKVVRSCLQALEKEGFIKKLKKGRAVSTKGQSYLTQTAKKIGSKKVQGIKKESIDTEKKE